MPSRKLFYVDAQPSIRINKESFRFARTTLRWFGPWALSKIAIESSRTVLERSSFPNSM